MKHKIWFKEHNFENYCYSKAKRRIVPLPSVSYYNEYPQNVISNLFDLKNTGTTVTVSFQLSRNYAVDTFDTDQIILTCFRDKGFSI